MPRRTVGRNDRRSGAQLPKRGDGRSPAQRDRDRVLYSSAFRRLAEVTQVVAANSGYVFHNRLTHSLQVAQVGRRLAERFNRDYPETVTGKYEINPDVVEAAAMAHDLGHPPFGHVIEEELNDLASQIGGFEGNAQSFRIICKLAFHSEKTSGLDLTRATLAAVLKYPWLKDQNIDKPRKWGAYNSEKIDFTFARAGLPSQEQTPEAFIMDWSDDITYCVHDLEDFYRAGRIPLHLLGARDDGERRYFFENVFQRRELMGNKVPKARQAELEETLRDLLFYTFPPMQAYRGTQRQRSQLRSFTGSLIDRYINGAIVETSGKSIAVKVAKEFRDEVEVLKELTWTYVIQDPALATQQLGQRHMVAKLFEAYTNAAVNRKEWKLFPSYYQERLIATASDDERIRVCVDLIAGMTEVQVHKVYSRITGHALESSLFDPLN